MQWQKKRNILAFPHGWQQPAKTEEWVYQRCLVDFPENNFVQVICFPWATLIDLLRSQQYLKAQQYLDALAQTPPKMTLRRVTVCQHIYMKDMLPIFKKIKITDIFWPHAIKNETNVEGICIHPFPLYPVCCKGNIDALKPLSERRYLYSFMGAYSSGLYLTPVRHWLFDLPTSESGLIVSRNLWHFDKHVYGEQVSGIAMDARELETYEGFSQDYVAVMGETVYCLCPSGSGPNSIRLWEALGFGCIPVILADTLQLPGEESLWQSATVKIPESETVVKNLPTILSALPLTQFSTEAIHSLWQRYGFDDFIFDIKKFVHDIKSG